MRFPLYSLYFKNRVFNFIYIGPHLIQCELIAVARANSSCDVRVDARWKTRLEVRLETKNGLAPATDKCRYKVCYSFTCSPCFFRLCCSHFFQDFFVLNKYKNIFYTLFMRLRLHAKLEIFMFILVHVFLFFITSSFLASSFYYHLYS